MKHDEFRVTQKIWEATLTGSSYIQYCNTLNTMLDHIPDYPVELIYTPDTNIQNFISILKNKFIKIPCSIINHFSFDNTLSILKYQIQKIN